MFLINRYMGYNCNIALIDNYNNYLSMRNLTPYSIFGVAESRYENKNLII